MADVASALADWSTTSASNSPNDSTSIGAGLADNLQQLQATVRAGLAYKGTDITAASTVNLATATGSRIDVTHASGTVAISSFGTVSAGIWKIVKFVITAGALSVTHSATSLKLPGGASITIADGDVMFLSSLGSGNWECLFYQAAQPIGFPAPITASAFLQAKADGSGYEPRTAQQVADVVGPLTAAASDTVAGRIAIATQAEQEAGTAPNKAVVSGRQHDHPSAAKAWVNFDGSGTVAINSSFKVSSITDNGVGNYTVNFADPMLDANYATVFGGANDGVANVGICTVINANKLAGSCRIATSTTSGSADVNNISAAFFR